MIEIMSISIFDHLRPKASVSRSFEKGEYLFHQGDPVHMLALVVEGCVHLMRFQADGHGAVLQRAGPMTVLAEASVFSEQYHCDAIAVTAGRALFVPIGTLRQLLERESAFALEWINHISVELKKVRSRAEILALRSVSARLDAWITVNESGLPPKGLWKNLAAEIGVSPEALYREIARRPASSR
ncbi:MAG: Crp/Fnr family transcriptional regulator [Agrobacterium tumefaciens]|nr:Crp/Fnr family transcriptional regulator [Agrobacterium tumefaciens]